MIKPSRGGKRNKSVSLRKNGGKGKGKSIPVDISRIKDKSLQSIENKIRSYNREITFIYDGNGQLVDGRIGQGTTVNVPSSWLMVENATVTHGHPVHEYNFGGTFSFGDIDAMARSQWAEYRAVAQGQGEYNYYVRRTEKARPKLLLARITIDENRIMSEFDRVLDSEKEKQLAKGLSDEQALHIAMQKAAGVVDRYWRETLPRFGFEYVKRKKKYEYGR